LTQPVARAALFLLTLLAGSSLDACHDARTWMDAQRRQQPDA
jgi:hypothetical protein